MSSIGDSEISAASDENNNASLQHSLSNTVLQTEIPCQNYSRDVTSVVSSDRQSTSDTLHSSERVECSGPENTSEASAFLHAAERGDVTIVKKLLEEGSSCQFQYHSALHLAASYGQTQVLFELLQAGVDVNNAVSNNGHTCLHEACQGGHLEVVEMLLEYVGDVDIVDCRGQTAAHIAAVNGELECIKTLHDRGALLTVIDSAGYQPIHSAVTRNHMAIVKYLYDCGLDLQVPDKLGRLPIHLAAKHGALQCLVSLVERNCDILAADAAGSLPIHHAAANNRLDCVRFLVAQGSSLNVTNTIGKTPLHVAAENGALKVVHWLLTNKGPINAVDAGGQTACHYAAREGRGEVFHCLVQHGADINVVNNNNDTAMETARKHGHPILIGRALSSEVVCSLCKLKLAGETWQSTHPQPQSLRQVSQLAQHVYTLPTTSLRTTQQTMSSSCRGGRPRPTDRRVSTGGTATRPSGRGSSSFVATIPHYRHNNSTTANNYTTLATTTTFGSVKQQQQQQRPDCQSLAARYFGEYLTPTTH